MFNNHSHATRPSHKRYFIIAFIVLFIIAVIVISITLPITLTKHNNSNNDDDNTNQTIVYESPAYNVTYLFPDDTTRSINGIDLDTVDRVKIARSFELGLSLDIQNILNIRQIYPNTAISINSKSRRKRFVQCDGDASGMTGPVLTFTFNSIYPSTQTCRSQTCINNTFDKIYQQFKTVKSLLINFNNVLKSLTLCSFGVSSSSNVEAPILVTESVTTLSPTTTQSPTMNPSTTTPVTTVVQTIVSVTTTALPTTVTVTTTTPVTTIVETTTPVTTVVETTTVTATITNVSSTVTSVVDVSSSTTNNPSINTRDDLNTSMSSTDTSDEDISSTDISDVDISSTIDSASSTTILPTTQTINSNLTLNETDVPLDVCLQKLPITQEQVPPYRITHTSTLFFQDSQTLLVAGASKFETFDALGTIEQENMINGEVLYKNCQRVIEVSLPVICYSSI